MQNQRRGAAGGSVNPAAILLALCYPAGMRGVGVLVGLLVISCAAPQKPVAREQPRATQAAPAPPPGEEREAEFASREDYEKRTHAIAEALTRMGFSIDTSALKVVVADDEQARRHLLQQIRVTTPKARLEGMATVRKLFGFEFGTNAEALEELAALGMLKGAHAYYDFVGKKLIFRNQPLSKLIDLDFTVTHELVHAYQDQVGDGLRGFFERHGTTQDAAQAARGAIEGHAVLVSTALMMERQGNDIRNVDPDFRDDSQGRLLSGEGLNALYSAGYRFMLTEFKRGGFDSTRRFLDQPPASTEQVLHPEKFPKDAPRAVTLPEWPKRAGEATKVHSDTLGEMLIYLLLVESEVPFATASVAATGWDGDRYAAYRLPDGGRALLWRTVWDREEDARAFETVVKARLEKVGKRATLRRSAHVVDLAFAEQPAALPHLEAALKTHPVRFRADPEDARSTASIEAEVVKRAQLEPRLEAGYWVHPEYSVKVPVPDGWRLVNIRGAYALAGQVHAGLADNITVLADQDLVGGSLEKYVEQNETVMSRLPTQKLLGKAMRTVSGKKVAILDLHITTGAIRLKARTFIIPRPGRFVIVQVGFHENRWAEVQPLLEVFEKKLLIDR